MATSMILLLENDEAAGAAIRATLEAAGYGVTVTATAEETIAQGTDHRLVVIDVPAPASDTAEVCRRIRARKDLASLPILCLSQSDEVEERVRLLEAGADDVMAKPIDPRELDARVEALLLRFQRSHHLAPITVPARASTRPTRVIACFSPKGGVGTTTIATNVAVTLAESRPERVAIIDLDLIFGQVATHLDMTPKHTLDELASDDDALRDPAALRDYGERHESGLIVYAAPLWPDRAGLISPGLVETLLGTAAGAFDLVVVDAGSFLDDRAMTTLECADASIIAVSPEIAALKALHSLVEYQTEVGFDRSKATYVVNHVFPREMLKVRDVEAAVGSPIAVELPYDALVYLKAVNEGIPVVRGAPRSAPAEALRRLAMIVTSDASLEPIGLPHDRRGGFFSGRRRHA